MQAKAILRNNPGSPRKIRLVIDTIRGLDVEQALNVLKFIPKKSNGSVEKLLMSAISNWQQHNEGIRVEDAGLYVKEVFADAGRVFKRFRPAPRGMAHKYVKPTNHVTMVVDSRVELKELKPAVEEKATKQVEKETKATELKDQGKKVEGKEAASKGDEQKAKKEQPAKKDDKAIKDKPKGAVEAKKEAPKKTSPKTEDKKKDSKTESKDKKDDKPKSK